MKTITDFKIGDHVTYGMRLEDYELMKKHNLNKHYGIVIAVSAKYVTIINSFNQRITDYSMHFKIDKDKNRNRRINIILGEF